MKCIKFVIVFCFMFFFILNAQVLDSIPVCATGSADVEEIAFPGIITGVLFFKASIKSTLQCNCTGSSFSMPLAYS